ncbi:unnamed protein product [Lupinus luteus]|uniref:FAF domain-containing protein n=1 Tax=Lupinus luteus TaxID=3873 RepID=A0AAV1YEW0_LUPLU
MVEIVYRGLQSCTVSNPIHIPFKSCLYEPNTKPHCEENSYYRTNTINNQSGCNFLQALSNVSNTYVHPQMKHSSVRLSPKSLELCTENLGNETGSDDMMDNEVEMLSYPPSFSWGHVEEKKGSKIVRGEKEKRKNFPPPLTTIRGGSESLKMMPHREGGRLVIQLTQLQPNGSCFQAERSHGRLRLSFFRNPIDDDGDDDDDDENEVFEEEDENEMIRESGELKEVQDIDEQLKNFGYNKTEEIEELEAEEEAELEEDENERDTYGNSWNIRIMEKYDRKGRSRSRSRCKEGDYENNGFGIAVVNLLTA